MKVGSVIYTLFACLSSEKIAFGVSNNIRLKINAKTPMIIKYSVDSLINEYIMKIAAMNKPIPNGTLYCIKVGSVMYILFALLSIDRIVFGANKSKSPKKIEIAPMLRIYIIL